MGEDGGREMCEGKEEREREEICERKVKRRKNRSETKRKWAGEIDEYFMDTEIGKRRLAGRRWKRERMCKK